MTIYERCKAAGLSDRDHLVLLRVASGRMDKEIASELGIERTSVSNILSRIYQRLGLAGRVSAVLWLANANPDDARLNMRQLVEDTGATRFTMCRQHPGGGRWAFRLHHGRKHIEIEMPGLPLEMVRYLGSPGQNIWDFPRLYVDGSSWVWEFAISAVKGWMEGRP